MNLKNKTILITGGSYGIGRALAERLAKECPHLILVARSENRLKEFVDQYGEQHRYYVCDLSDYNQVTQLTGLIKKDFFNLDVLINVAGIGVYKNLRDVTFADWSNSLSINITAPFLLTKNLLPLLQKAKDSLILNIGSGAGTIPMPGKSTYNATKFAFRGWTLSLAEEFQDKAPRFCLITLGSTITNFSGMTIAEKQKEHAKGKAYFPVEWVANKLVEIIKDGNRETEITLFPSEFGFGVWKKP
jgi:short-subunit dehydrogenase